jgi:hypothetical protein
VFDPQRTHGVSPYSFTGYVDVEVLSTKELKCQRKIKRTRMADPAANKAVNRAEENPAVVGKVVGRKAVEVVARVAVIANAALGRA